MYRYNLNLGRDPGHFHFDGVEIKKGLALIPKNRFSTEEDRQEWLSSLGQKLAFNPESRQERQFNIRMKALDAPVEFESAKKVMTRGEKYAPENFEFYQETLASNMIDRHKERITFNLLQSFTESLFDKPKLMQHDYESHAVGRIYQVWLEEMDIETAWKEFSNIPVSRELFKTHAEMVIKRDGGLFRLVDKFFLPSITDEDKELITRVDIGNIKACSIGFRAPRFEKYTENGVVLFWEWDNDGEMKGEAYESSFVTFGAQYNARVTKSEESNNNKYQTTNGGMMNFKVDNLGIDLQLEGNEQELADLSTTITSKAAEKDTQIAALKHELEQKQAYEAELKGAWNGELPVAKALTEMQVKLDKALDFVLAYTVKMAVMAKMVEAEKANDEIVRIKSFDIQTIFDLAKRYEQIAEKTAGVIEQTPAAEPAPVADPIVPEIKKEVSLAPRYAYETI